jgi:hypothetical protein
MSASAAERQQLTITHKVFWRILVFCLDSSASSKARIWLHSVALLDGAVTFLYVLVVQIERCPCGGLLTTRAMTGKSSCVTALCYSLPSTLGRTLPSQPTTRTLFLSAPSSPGRCLRDKVDPPDPLPLACLYRSHRLLFVESFLLRGEFKIRVGLGRHVTLAPAICGPLLKEAQNNKHMVQVHPA